MPHGLRLQFYISMPLGAREVTLSIQKASLTVGFESKHEVPLIMAPSFFWYSMLSVVSAS